MDNKRLQARDLTCVKSEYELFSDLSTSVTSGEVLRITGANGSGKTSLLKILIGLDRPDSGQVYWCDEPIHTIRREFAADSIYVGHKLGIKAELTVRENLQMHAVLAGQARCWNTLDIAGAIGLDQFIDNPTYTLSAGQQRRLSLARLLLPNRSLWLLDEPQAALDKQGVALIESWIHKHVNAGGMVVLTTHQAISLPADRLQTLEIL